MVAAEDALLEQADQLIVEAATGVRTLSPNELQLVLDHIAQAGFEPTPNVRAGRRAAGILWQGRTVSSRSTFSAACPDCAGVAPTHELPGLPGEHPNGDT